MATEAVTTCTTALAAEAIALQQAMAQAVHTAAAAIASQAQTQQLLHNTLTVALLAQATMAATALLRLLAVAATAVVHVVAAAIAAAATVVAHTAAAASEAVHTVAVAHMVVAHMVVAHTAVADTNSHKQKQDTPVIHTTNKSYTTTYTNDGSWISSCRHSFCNFSFSLLRASN